LPDDVVVVVVLVVVVVVVVVFVVVVVVLVLVVVVVFVVVVVVAAVVVVVVVVVVGSSQGTPVSQRESRIIFRQIPSSQEKMTSGTLSPQQISHPYLQESPGVEQLSPISVHSGGHSSSSVMFMLLNLGTVSSVH